MTLHKTKPPLTCQRGQKPIDGISLSENLLEGAHGGYLELNDSLGSNHQGIWLDLTAADLFGDPNTNYMLAKARRLQCKDPRIIKKYTEKLETLLQAQQLSKCTTKFYQNIQGKLSWKQSQEYESIDKEIMAAKLSAERMYQKIKASNHRWTPELTTMIQAVLYQKG